METPGWSLWIYNFGVSGCVTRLQERVGPLDMQLWPWPGWLVYTMGGLGWVGDAMESH